MQLIDNPENRARAEQYADWVERNLRSYGVTTDNFCDAQRLVWRQQAIDAFMGHASVPKVLQPLISPQPPSET